MNRVPISRSIYNLQRMLRTISMNYPEIPTLFPDGVFGERTLEAVMRFQQKFHPPVIGKVDFHTWNAIVALFQKVEEDNTQPRAQPDYPTFFDSIMPGDHSVHLYLVQSMLKAISHGLVGLEHETISGIHDEPSVQNIRWLQRVSGQEESGRIDSRVWDMLERIYTVFVNYAETPWISRPKILCSWVSRQDGHSRD